jgi:hypothetical protein
LCRIKYLKGVKQQITPSNKDLRRKLSEGEEREGVVSHGKEEKLKGRKNITRLAFEVHFSVG